MHATDRYVHKWQAMQCQALPAPLLCCSGLLDTQLLGHVLGAVDTIPKPTWDHLHQRADYASFEALLAMVRVQMLWARMPEPLVKARRKQRVPLRALSALVAEG